MNRLQKALVLSSLFCVAAVFASVWTADAKNSSLADRFGNKTNRVDISKKDQSGKYSFDMNHSSIGFKVRHMGLVDVPGNFRNFEGMLSFDAKKSSNSTVEFTAEVKSVDTGVNARDNHLRSKDFFEVMTYPDMSFKSTRIKKKGKRYNVKGDLTLKGVTKEIEFPVRIYGPIKDDRGNIRMGVSGTTVINRRDFDVSYGGNLPGGTAVLSDGVVVDIQIESVKKKSEAEEQ